MNLRKRTLGGIALTFLALAGSAYLLVSTVMLTSFDRLEKRSVSEHLARAENALDARIVQLVEKASDWAAWDDTYNFVEDKHAEYIEENYVSQSLGPMGVSGILLRNLAGETLAEVAIDPSGSNQIPTPSVLLEFLNSELSLSRFESVDSSHSGVVLLDGIPILFTSLPVINTQRQGPIRGNLVFWIWLNESLVAKLSDQTKLNLTLLPYTQLPTKDRQIAEQIIANAKPAIVPLSEREINAYQVIYDVFGKPALLLKVSRPREIYLHGKFTQHSLMVVLALAAIIYAISTVLLLEHFVISRITNLMGEVDEITTQSDMTKRVTEIGSDEIGRLGGVINRLVTSVQSSQQAMQHAKDAAEQANLAKTEFLRNTSHELRTPMNGVMGMAQLISLTALDEEQKEYLRTLQSSGDALMTLINDLLDLSKIETGQLTLNAHPFDCLHLVEEAIDLFAIPASRKDIELQLIYSPKAPVSVVGDPDRLRQLLINLLGNALKFTTSGHVSLEVECTRISGQHASLRFLVRDTGIGISSEQLSSIFAAFGQADTSTSRKYGGLGLGLTISSHIARLMGGHLSVESIPNKGSTFVLHLQTPISVSTRRDLESAPSNIWRALVVHPHEVAQHALAANLSVAEVPVEALPNLDEFFSVVEKAQAERRRYDLIIVDHSLVTESWLAEVQTRFASDLRGAQLVLSVPLARRREFSDFAQKGFDNLLVSPFHRSDVLDILRTPVSDDIVHHPSGSSGKWPTLTVPPRSLSQTLPNLDFSKSQARVLLVEDNNVNQRLTLRMLEKFGCEVKVAENGQQAVDLAAVETFDLILMDCQMPILDGYEATRHIRSNAGPCAGIPIIALTAHAMSGEKEKCLQAGMNDFLTKPLVLSEIKAAIFRWGQK